MGVSPCELHGSWLARDDPWLKIDRGGGSGGSDDVAGLVAVIVVIVILYLLLS